MNWNGARLLSACLQALAAQDYPAIQTIVVDNGSVDGSLEMAAQQDGIRLIRNGSNLGFAAANNIGLEAASGEFILLLNYDVILEPDYVSRLVAALHADTLRGSASGKLLRPSTGEGAAVLDSTGHVMYRNMWPTNRGEDEPDGPAFASPGEIFGVCAAAGLYRRAMLMDVAVDGEVLDSSFFAYLEDVDLDWRARLRGWTSWYEPSAVAIHHRSGSGGWYSTAIQRHIFKNRILMIIKNDGGLSVATRLPGILAFTAVKLGLGVLSAPSFATAVWEVLRYVPGAWRKRRQVQARRRVTRAALERWYQPYPYIKKLRHGHWGRSRRPWTSPS